MENINILRPLFRNDLALVFRGESEVYPLERLKPVYD